MPLLYVCYFLYAIDYVLLFITCCYILYAAICYLLYDICLFTIYDIYYTFLLCVDHVFPVFSYVCYRTQNICSSTFVTLAEQGLSSGTGQSERHLA